MGASWIASSLTQADPADLTSGGTVRNCSSRSSDAHTTIIKLCPSKTRDSPDDRDPTSMRMD